MSSLLSRGVEGNREEREVGGVAGARASAAAARGLRNMARRLLAAVLVVTLARSGDAALQKQNTTWVYPTLGCRANRAGENCYPYCPMQGNEKCEKSAVCQPTYVKANFSQLVQWTMAAANPTPPDRVYIIRKGGRADTGKSCCGFSPVLAENIWSVTKVDPVLNAFGVVAPDVINWPPMSLADVLSEERKASVTGNIISVNKDPVNMNITHVTFRWNVTKQELSQFAMTPLYNISYDAQYHYSITDGSKRFHNNSACRKDVIFRICSQPFFEADPRDSTMPLKGGPKPASLAIVDNAACGLSMHKACINSPGYDEAVKGVMRTIFNVGMFDGIGNNHGVRIGEEIRLNISLSTLDYGGKVEMRTVDDPGLPIGADLTNDLACGEYKVCRTLTWTPRKGQEGRVHDAHVLGRSYTTLPQSVAPCDELYTKETVFRIKVMTPASSWQAPLDNVGQFTGDLTAWPGNAVVGTEFEVEFLCKSNYRPKIDMDGGAARFDWVRTEEVGNGERVSTYSFRYTPVRGDEGSTKIWNFHCGDDQYVADRLIRTVAVKTKLCSYSVASGETLSTMTRRYQLSTNWLNIWNANPNLLTDPDLDLEAGAQLRIGPVYAVKAGDTLKTIAGTPPPPKLTCECRDYTFFLFALRCLTSLARNFFCLITRPPYSITVQMSE